jgi:hypothetical protein
VLPKLQQNLLDTSYFSGFLLNNTTFQEFAKLSMLGGESEDFFRSIASRLSKEDNVTFDVNCQQFLTIPLPSAIIHAGI